MRETRELLKNTLFNLCDVICVTKRRDDVIYGEGSRVVDVKVFASEDLFFHIMSFEHKKHSVLWKVL